VRTTQRKACKTRKEPLRAFVGFKILTNREKEKVDGGRKAKASPEKKGASCLRKNEPHGTVAIGKGKGKEVSNMRSSAELPFREERVRRGRGSRGVSNFTMARKGSGDIVGG